MRLKLISVFLLGSLLAGTPVSAQKKEQKSVLKKGPNVSLNITSKKNSLNGHTSTWDCSATILA